MDVIMPQLGETVTEGTVANWYKKVGDAVKADEPLFDVETDKVTTEIPSISSGVLKEIRVEAGATVPVDLQWRRLPTADPHLRVAIRLVDATGLTWAQTDQSIGNGYVADNQWPGDQTLDDRHGVMVPTGTPPGDYALILNVYSADHPRALAATGDSTVRTAAVDALRGTPWPEQFSFRMLENRITREWAARESEARALNTSQLETRLVEAQLQALQRQLHPHFLFNTLNTVVGLLRQDPSGAEAMIVRLGDLLRVLFRSRAHQQVRLTREIELTEQYLAIQRIRFGGSLVFTTNVDSDASEALVPVLLLQPIVENSVRHGFSRRGGRGTIHVSAEHRGASLILGVSDDGVGPAGIDVCELNEGVGLTNTRARLEHLYPCAHSLRFEAHPGSGFHVTIELPWAVEADAEASLAAPPA